MANKFRIGQIGRALSSGLGLFAEKKVKEEKDRIDKQWQMTMQNIADARAQARNDQEFQRALALNAQRFAMDAQAREDTQAFTAGENRKNREARAGEFEQTMEWKDQTRHDEFVANREEQLAKSLQRIDERYEELRKDTQLMFDPERRTALETQYWNERDDAIEGFTQSMIIRASKFADQPAYEQYRINGKEELASIVQGMGATPAGATRISEDFWKYASMPGDVDEAGAGGMQRSGKDPYNSVGAPPAPVSPTSSMDSAFSAARGAAPGPVQAPRVDPAPRTPMPSESEPLYQQGFGPEPFTGGQQLFDLYKNKPWIRSPASRERMGLPPK